LWLSSMMALGQVGRATLPDAPSVSMLKFGGTGTSVDSTIGGSSSTATPSRNDTPISLDRDDSAPRPEVLEHIYPLVLHKYPDSPSYTPLSRQEKFEYFRQGAKSGYTFISAGVTAASWHAYGDPPYGPGMNGAWKSYGAALGQRELGMFLQRYAMPALFREDPRYFAAPASDGVFKRGVYAASRLVLTKADSGAQRLNCAYLIGGLGSALISNSFIRQRDYGAVSRDFLVGMTTDAAYNIAREFWPSLRGKFPTKHLKKLGDVVIGPHGLPNPDKK